MDRARDVQVFLTENCTYWFIRSLKNLLSQTQSHLKYLSFVFTRMYNKVLSKLNVTITTIYNAKVHKSRRRKKSRFLRVVASLR